MFIYCLYHFNTALLWQVYISSMYIVILFNKESAASPTIRPASRGSTKSLQYHRSCDLHLPPARCRLVETGDGCFRKRFRSYGSKQNHARTEHI